MLPNQFRLEKRPASYPKLFEKNSKINPRAPTPNSLKKLKKYERKTTKIVFFEFFFVFFEFFGGIWGRGSGGKFFSRSFGFRGFGILDPCSWPGVSQVSTSFDNFHAAPISGSEEKNSLNEGGQPLRPRWPTGKHRNPENRKTNRQKNRNFLFFAYFFSVAFPLFFLFFAYLSSYFRDLGVSPIL